MHWSSHINNKPPDILTEGDADGGVGDADGLGTRLMYTCICTVVLNYLALNYLETHSLAFNVCDMSYTCICDSSVRTENVLFMQQKVYDQRELS